MANRTLKRRLQKEHVLIFVYFVQCIIITKLLLVNLGFQVDVCSDIVVGTVRPFELYFDVNTL